MTDDTNSDDANGNPNQVRQPPWLRPSPAEGIAHDPRLRIMNSLTREKEHFVTMDGTDRITWYMYVVVPVFATVSSESTKNGRDPLRISNGLSFFCRVLDTSCTHAVRCVVVVFIGFP